MVRDASTSAKQKKKQSLPLEKRLFGYAKAEKTSIFDVTAASRPKARPSDRVANSTSIATAVALSPPSTPPDIGRPLVNSMPPFTSPTTARPSAGRQSMWPRRELGSYAACRARGPLKAHRPLALIDRPSRLLMLATPKGGSSSACMIMYAHTGQLDAARVYVPPHASHGGLLWGDVSKDWEHNYREQVWEKQPEHAHPLLPAPATYLDSCRRFCVDTQPPIACVKVVRWPPARAVSSFLYMMRALSASGHWKLIKHVVVEHVNERGGASQSAACLRTCKLPPMTSQKSVDSISASTARCVMRCATFEDMVSALERATLVEQKGKNLHWLWFTGWGHIFPQASECDADQAVRNATVYLPLETLSNGLRMLETVAANFKATDAMTGSPAEGRRTNGTRYHQQIDLPELAGLDLARTPFDTIARALASRSGAAPPYQRFLTDPRLVDRLRCVFGRDLRMYAHACSQPLLQSPSCQGDKCLPVHCNDPLLRGLLGRR